MSHPRRNLDGARKALSPEFALVAACCVWPPSNKRNAAIAAAAAGVDWRRVLDVAARQRVEGQVRDGLARAKVQPPEAIALELRTLAEGVARDSLRHAAESARLQGLLDAAGVANLVLKGAAVEMLAYGGLGMKTAWDIDLLVAPEQAAAALRVLGDQGYVLTEPAGLSPEQFSVWADLTRECELRRETTGMVVELHWRLVDGPSLLPTLSVSSPSQVVALSPGLSLRTLATEELVAYLFVHGALHGWARLKWLADVAAILAQQTPAGVERLYHRAVALGAGLCPAQALLLCEALLEPLRPPDLAADLSRSATARWLVDVALWAMARGDADIRLKEGPMATVPIALSHFALGGTLRHARQTAAQKWISVHDRTRMPLPRGLHPLYAVMRGPLWLWRRIRS